MALATGIEPAFPVGQTGDSTICPREQNDDGEMNCTAEMVATGIEPATPCLKGTRAAVAPRYRTLALQPGEWW